MTNKFDHIIHKMFIDSLLVMLLAEVSVSISNMIDGVMVSNFLGTEAFAAQNMTYPFFGMIGLPSGMLATGVQMTVSRSVGKGDFKAANDFFSAATVVAIFLATIIVGVGFLWTDKVVALLGATGSAIHLAEYVRLYFLGILMGTIPLIGNVIIMPIVQINGNAKYVKSATILKVVVNCTGNLLNVFVFGGGMFGMGISTAIAEYVGLIILLLSFMQKNQICQFEFKRMGKGRLKSILALGAPIATKRLCNIVRPMIVNRWIILVGTSAAMSGFGVRENLYGFVMIPGLSVAASMMMITSVFWGEQDKTGLKNLFCTGASYCILLSGGVAILVYIFAPILTAMYVSDNLEVMHLAINCMRWFALGIPFLSFNFCYTNHLQGIGKIKSVHILNILQNLIYPVSCTFLLGKLFGIRGVYAGFSVAEIVLSITIFGLICKENKKIPDNMFEFMLLPKKFGISEENILEFSIHNLEEVVTVSKQIGEFCEAHNVDKRRSFYTALCAEEIAANTVKHGFTDGKKHGLTIRVIYKDNDLILRLRDDCHMFDIKKRYNEADQTDISSNVGIRLVMKLSKEVLYVNTLNTNNLTITL